MKKQIKQGLEVMTLSIIIEDLKELLNRNDIPANIVLPEGWN